jgi:hypothetical protein
VRESREVGEQPEPILEDPSQEEEMAEEVP